MTVDVPHRVAAPGADHRWNLSRVAGRAWEWSDLGVRHWAGGPIGLNHCHGLAENPETAVLSEVSHPGSNTRATGGAAPESHLHPRLASQLEALGLDGETAPDRENWARFLGWVDGHHRESDQLSRELVDGMRGWSSFENLFRISPIPIMEQDYTQMERWMERLRARGVLDLRGYLGDIEAIRAVVPMIRIVAANPAAVRAVGLPAEDLIGPIDPRIVNPGSESGWVTQLEAVWNRQPVAHAAFTASTADGRTYDAESILAAPVVDGAPDFSRAVFTIIDVTGHRDEERRMHELVELKNGFLASVSHEIRTPLTAILGFARVLDEMPDLGEEERTLMISSIVQHSQEVADLVEDLLVAARAEMGQVEVVKTGIDVAAQVRQILEAGGSYTQGVALECRVGDAHAVGDPSRVRQIVRNLLTNAERYGGPSVGVVVSGDAERIHVEVIDDGPGLPPSEWERIFEPYQRAHRITEQPESVGIGLAISRQLAELMGGTLDYGRDGIYSVFRLGLPRREA